MLSLRGRREDSDSESGFSSSDEETTYQVSRTEISGQEVMTQKARRHDFLKKTADADFEDHAEEDSSNIVSRLARVTDQLDQCQYAFLSHIRSKEWRKAYETWSTMLKHLEYVLTQKTQLPYPFLSAARFARDTFTAPVFSQVREEVPRDQRKSLTDLQKSVEQYYSQYEEQIEGMDQASDAEEDEEVNTLAHKWKSVDNAALCALAQDNDLSEEAIAKKIEALRTTQGKKSTDRRLFHFVLEALLTQSAAYPRAQGLVNSLLFASVLDNRKRGDEAIDSAHWMKAASYLEKLINLMDKHPRVVVEDLVSQRKTAPLEPDAFALTASVFSLVSRLLEEYNEGIKKVDVYSDEYLRWLRAESHLVVLLQRGLNMYAKKPSEDINVPSELATSLLYLLHYRKSSTHKQLVVAYGTPPHLRSVPAVGPNLRESMYALHHYVRGRASTDECKLRATLYFVYHLAQQGDHSEAHRLFLTAKCGKYAHQTKDVAIRVQYNRCIMQIAIAAFRIGNIAYAGQSLLNIYSLNKYKELVAQAQDRRRQETGLRHNYVPPHMHINTEITDAIYFIYCMLFHDYSRRKEFQVYRIFVTSMQRQHFLGPPESSRERIYAAISAFRKADWETSVSHIRAIGGWKAIGLDTGATEKLLDPLFQTIKLECLKNFLAHHRGYYGNIGLNDLVAKFGLDIATVRKKLTRMILSRELYGSFNPGMTHLHIGSSHHTVHEKTLLYLMDRVQQLSELTERAQDQKASEQSGAVAPGSRDNTYGTSRYGPTRYGRINVRGAALKQVSAKNPLNTFRVSRSYPTSAQGSRSTPTYRRVGMGK